MANPFHEGNCEVFAPTYRIKKGIEKFPEINASVTATDGNEIYTKERGPAWTDRIFYFS